MGVFARVLPHVPANKSQRRNGYPWGGHLDGVNETYNRTRFRRIHHLDQRTLRWMGCRGVFLPEEPSPNSVMVWSCATDCMALVLRSAKGVGVHRPK
ncbi:hypothetical protein HaLaN_26613, partial [Haematococcus lacustris]